VGLKRRRRTDPVDPQTALDVFARDRGCVAVRLGEDPADCAGRLTLEHVKSALRMGKRAPSDMAHLVALCEAHTESGAKAGHQWNTDKRNRAAVRAYLAEVSDADRRLPATS
jgi:hypothetical protein